MRGAGTTKKTHRGGVEAEPSGATLEKQRAHTESSHTHGGRAPRHHQVRQLRSTREPGRGPESGCVSGSGREPQPEGVGWARWQVAEVLSQASDVVGWGVTGVGGEFLPLITC